FAHGGGAFPYTLGRMDRGFVSRPDLCATHISNPPSTYMSKVYVDSLVHDVKALRYLIEVFGRERVALGSDYPFPLGEACPGALIEKMALDRATQDWLLGGAALSFLGLNESLRRMTQAVA
ncbi:MAG TPA: amidohydrolase family protein, partial [Candidatus Xenobia bacterium]